MPSGATNLHIAAQNGGVVTLNWNPAPIEGLPYASDLIFVDIATENGFVNYQPNAFQGFPINAGPLSPSTQEITTLSLPPGTYWARVNTHYHGLGVPEYGPLDRGWFPSQHIPIVVDPAPPLPTGVPATNLAWVPGNHRLGWTAGHGSAAITRVSVDLSTFPNFDDILASPFVSVPTCQGQVVGFPFAFDVAPNCTGLDISGALATDFYIRVNTLFGNRVWYPSTVKHIVQGVDTGSTGGFPWLLLAGAGAVAAYMYYQGGK